MYESSQARQPVSVTFERATAENATRIRAVRGWVAESEALSCESLAFHFAAHGAGTMADGAQLDLKLTHVPARCEECGTQYAPDHHVTLCPECGSTNGKLLGETGLGIDEIDVE